MKNLFTNWKTTSAGLTMIGGSIIHLVFAVKGGRADENTWTIAFGLVVGGAGLIFAGDASQSVQQPPAPAPKVEVSATPPAAPTLESKP